MWGLRNKKRIKNLNAVIIQVARGNYNIQCELSGKNDEIDALAMGLNMLIDDLRINLDLKQQNDRMKKLNSELEIATKKAQDSDRLKSAFLANMSHELRSPMNAIMGFSSLITKKLVSEEKSQKYYKYIESAGEQLLALINDIVDVSKLESDQIKIQKKYHSVNKLLCEIVEIERQNRNLLNKPNLNLNLKLQPCKDFYIETDGLRFKQIFINLINNALKFTQEGSVEIGYEYNGFSNNNELKIYVKDTGIGIPESSKELIFNRFQQVRDEHQYEGTGLGLSIVKGLVELMGAQITVNSEVGKGSDFQVTFPNCMKHYPGEVLHEQEILEDQLKSLNLSDFTIYIADDNLDSFLLLEAILKPHKANIKYAKTGKELLNFINEKVPDLVLLDIHMPEMNGLEVIRKIRNQNYKFPVIAQTAFVLNNQKNTIIEAGCDAFLPKPISYKDLIKEIRYHLC